MRKLIFTICSVLFLFFISVTDAAAPTKPQVITNYVPVVLEGVPRIQPKILTPTPIVEYTKTVAGAKAYALDTLGALQFTCLDKLFTRESHWNPFDLNRSSGAYGIPQALPGSKMASIASDWRTNPLTQVKWGIKYVNQRYGSACGAWNHSEIFGWY